MRWLLVVVVGLAWPALASADRITVGLYAPSAPLGGPSDRLQYVTRLATHLDAATANHQVTGRVFARAADFEAAVRRGELQFAVLDAPYAAAHGLPYHMLAATTRGGAAQASWYMVAPTTVAGLADLAGATVAMPRTGHRENWFLTRVLLEGEVEPGYFGGITRTPDAFSAVTTVELGRARAAFVPSGVTLPSGIRRVLTLRAVGWPVLVALPGADKGLSATFAARVRGFGEGALSGTTSPDAGGYGSLKAAFSPRRRTPRMVAGKPTRGDLAALVGGRTFEVTLTPVLQIVGGR